MSGPKSISYRVESAAEIEARARRSLLAVRGQLEERAEQLAARCAAARSEFGDAITAAAPARTVRGEAGTLAELNRSIDLLRSQMASAEAALQRQIQEARVSRLLAAIPARTGAARSAGDALSRHAEARAAAADGGREQIIAAVERAMTALDGDVERKRAAEIEARAETLLELESLQAARVEIDQLRLLVQRANAAAAEARERQRRAERWRDELAGVDAATGAAARTAIDAYEQGAGDPDAVAALVTAAHEAAAREADRRYAAEAVRASLERLGYDVGAGFATALVRDGVVDVRRPRWGSYGLRVRAAQGSDELRLHLVRAAGAATHDQAARDADAERAFCADLPALFEHLGDAGVRAATASALPIGAVPVPVSAAITAPAAARARARDGERELEA